MHDITIDNNKVNSTALMLKYTGLYLNALGLRYRKQSGVHTEAHHTSEIHETAFLLASLLCMC